MEKCGFVMSFEILLSCRMAKKCGFYALLQILLLHMNFMDTINCANATHRVSVKKSWCVQWLLFVGPPELCGVWTAQSWWASPPPLSNWLGCGTVQVPRLVYRLIQPGKQTNHANHPYWIWAKNFESMHPRKDYTDWGWYVASACLTCEIWNEKVMQCL